MFMYCSSFVFARGRYQAAVAREPVGEWDHLCFCRRGVHGHVCVIMSSAGFRLSEAQT